MNIPLMKEIFAFNANHGKFKELFYGKYYITRNLQKTVKVLKGNWILFREENDRKRLNNELYIKQNK